MEDYIKFYANCEYQDQYGQIWISKWKENRKCLWREESGWGLWNHGIDLDFVKKKT